MDVLKFVKAEFSGWGKYERFLFPAVILLIVLISVSVKDSKIALISAVCGISYTILAGKGKISCYLFGLCGTLLYTYLSFKNALFGNMLLYGLYYFPMEIVGIFKWKNKLKKTSQEIIKTQLSVKERVFYLAAAILLSIIATFILKGTSDASPCIDAITVVLSVFGMLLTVKRCIEQWYVWFAVNALSVWLWVNAYIHGSNCFATILMWFVYLILSIYFLYTWKKELTLDSSKI